MASLIREICERAIIYIGYHSTELYNKKIEMFSQKRFFYTFPGGTFLLDIFRKHNCLFCLVDFQSVTMETYTILLISFKLIWTLLCGKTNLFPVYVCWQFRTGNEDISRILLLASIH